MTIGEFGQKIKTKYPQYSDFSDEEIGQKMLAKYPQYQSVVLNKPEATDTFLQGHPVLKGISDFVGTTGLGKGIAQGIFLKFTPEGKNLLKLVEQGQIKQEDVEKIIGNIATTKEIAGSAVQMAGNVALGGTVGAPAKTALRRVGQTALQTGAASSVIAAGSALGEGRGAGDIAKSAAIGAGIGAATGGFITGLTELASYASKVLPEKLVERTLGIKPKVIETGRSPAPRFLQEGKGITKGGVLQNAKSIVSQTDQAIDDILTTKPGKIGSGQVIGDIKRNLSSSYGTSLGADDIDRIIKNLPIDIVKKNQEITLPQANKLRQIIDNKFLGDAKWMRDADPVNISALKAAANSLRNIVQSQDDRLPALYSKLSDNIILRNSVNKEIARRHALTLALEVLGSGLYGSIAGGGVNSKSLGESIKAFAIIRGLTSTPAYLGTAKTVNAVGRAAQTLKIKPAIEAVTKIAGSNLVK